MEFLKLVHEKLSVEAISELVSSPSCGAISLFVGTTRNTFEGNNVINLEYEVYESMAMKVMQKICADIREKWPDVENIAIFHRLGAVPVKDASIVIAVSSPHRADAIQATEWCINAVKTSVPIWKKEVYADKPAEWKENKESVTYPPRFRPFKLDMKSEVKAAPVPAHLIQIRTSTEEIESRIQKFIERKRTEINESNIRDFCCRDNHDNFNTCARIDAKLVKRKDSKGHLQVNRVLNTYQRDRNSLEYMENYNRENGIEERLKNVEVHLGFTCSIDKQIYRRIKNLEDRLLYLESVSPEYMQFWQKNGNILYKSSRKRIYTVEELDNLIVNLEMKKSKSDVYLDKNNARCK